MYTEREPCLQVTFGGGGGGGTVSLRNSFGNTLSTDPFGILGLRCGEEGRTKQVGFITVCGTGGGCGVFGSYPGTPSRW